MKSPNAPLCRIQSNLNYENFFLLVNAGLFFTHDFSIHNTMNITAGILAYLSRFSDN